MEYRYGSHTVFQIEYHFVWVTKYRYKILSGEIGLRVREVIRQNEPPREYRKLFNLRKIDLMKKEKTLRYSPE